MANYRYDIPEYLEPGCEIETGSVVAAAFIDERPEIKSYVLDIYPNPVKNQITLSSAALNNRSTIIIHDILGCVLDEQNISINSQETVLDVSTFPPGVYMVVVKGENQLRAQGKFVKQ